MSEALEERCIFKVKSDFKITDFLIPIKTDGKMSPSVHI